MRRRGWAAVIAAVAIGALAVSGCSKDDPAPTAFVVGDSLTVGAEIGGLGRDGSLTVDAKEGRTTEQGVPIIEATDLAGYDRVIVALGTNDYTDTAAGFAPKIDQVMEAIGPDVPVTWVNADSGTPKLSPTADGVNAALAAAGDRYPNLTIADWDAYINARADVDDLRSGDQVHDTAAGYRVRAAWMAALANG